MKALSRPVLRPVLRKFACLLAALGSAGIAQAQAKPAAPAAKKPGGARPPRGKPAGFNAAFFKLGKHGTCARHNLRRKAGKLCHRNAIAAVRRAIGKFMQR